MKSFFEILNLYKEKDKYFIGPTVHNSIAVEKNGGVWTNIWSSILNAYINVSNKREFYLNLSYTLLTLLSSNSRFTDLIDTIFNELLDNRILLKKQFILNKAIQQDEIDLIAEYLCLVYCATFKTQDIHQELYTTIRSYCVLAEEQFNHEKNKAYASEINTRLVNEDDSFVKKVNQIISTTDRIVMVTGQQKSIHETIFEVVFKHSNVTSVLNKDLKFEGWQNLGPIFWIWFHLTAGMFVVNKFDENCKRLKEYFLIMDHYICSVCEKNFKQRKIELKNDLYFQGLQVDVFIIKIHSTVRVSQFKNLSHFQFIDKSYTESLGYETMIERFTQEYQQWWRDDEIYSPK
jgi:hypothetical protein